MSALKKLTYNKVSAPIADAMFASIGIAAGLSEFEALSAVTDDGFRHLCQQNGHRYAEELESSRAMAADARSFLNEPLLTVLGRGAKVHYEVDYNSSTIKSSLLEGLAGFLTTVRSSSSLRTSILNCADEIYTNSIYNAPFVDLYSQFNPGVGRDRTSVFLAEQYHVHMVAGSNEDRVALICRDPFGSLDVESFLRRIRRTHELGAARAMTFGTGGAGLGSYIIFNECSSLYVAAEPGVATVIGCTFPLGMSGLQRQILPKHLHWTTATRETK